jgi:hypothetical protein
MTAATKDLTLAVLQMSSMQQTPAFELPPVKFYLAA